MRNVGPLGTIDNLDDRREAFYLLCKLSPAERGSFMAWCCGACEAKWAGIRWYPVKGDAHEAWFDFAGLVMSYRLEPIGALRELERRVSAR